MWEAADEGIVDGRLQNLVSPEDVELVVEFSGSLVLSSASSSLGCRNCWSSGVNCKQKFWRESQHGTREMLALDSLRKIKAEDYFSFMHNTPANLFIF
jgi:hypothetical protein